MWRPEYLVILCNNTTKGRMVIFMITIEQLYQFLSAAKYMNFQLAAQEQFKHPSSISKSVIAMEQELNTVLFERKNHALYLTQAGELLQNEGERIASELEELYSNVKRVGAGYAGQITMFFPFPQSYLSITGVYNEFCGKYPDVQWRIISGSLEGKALLFDCNATGEIDIGISFYNDIKNDPRLPDYEFIKIKKDYSYIYAAEGNPLHGRKSVTLEELIEVPILINNHMKNLSVAHMDKELYRRRGHGFTKLERLKHSDSQEVYLMKLLSGKYICCATQGLFEQCGNMFTRIPVTDFDLSHEIVLCWRRDNRNPSNRLFLDMVFEYFGREKEKPDA